MYLKHYHIYIIMLTFSQTFYRRLNVSHLGHFLQSIEQFICFRKKKIETKLEKNI